MNKLIYSLLIGVACIGLILLLLPAFVDYFFPRGCGAPSLASKGRSIALAIISKNIDLEQLGEYDLFPESPRFAEELDEITEFSEAYFAKLFALSSDFRFSMFCGGGIVAATNMDEFLKGDKNVWSYIGGCTLGSPLDNPPFLFSQNLRLTNEDLYYYSKPENVNDKSFAAKLDASIKPYGDSRVVFVFRDGSTSIFRAEDLTPSAFFNGYEMPPNAYVVHPR